MMTQSHTILDHYALRCVSGPLSGQRWPLHDQVVVGRSQHVEITLPEEQVSRHHAHIAWDGARLTLTDLKSTNGTYLNGHRADDPVPLATGDRVLIGVSIFAIEAVMKEISGVMSGSLEAIGFEAILQFFGSARRTGVLRLETEHGNGAISLSEGRLMAAHVEGHGFSPEKAFFRMMGWREGIFIFLDGDILQSGVEPLNTEPMSMLLEGLRQRDELEAQRAQLDLTALPEGAVLALPTHLPALRDLNLEALDLVQLAHELGAVESILDTSLANDFETLQALHQLLHQGYLECL